MSRVLHSILWPRRNDGSSALIGWQGLLRPYRWDGWALARRTNGARTVQLHLWTKHPAPPSPPIVEKCPRFEKHAFRLQSQSRLKRRLQFRGRETRRSETTADGLQVCRRIKLASLAGRHATNAAYLHQAPGSVIVPSNHEARPPPHVISLAARVSGSGN
ncbi:hypothetical protein LX36DRAFT_222532 [Colletotrichum falcatum]|nr:hypothetical protein LX36DRAFT_222532 [Colletotrichum falcatum]